MLQTDTSDSWYLMTSKSGSIQCELHVPRLVFVKSLTNSKDALWCRIRFDKDPRVLNAGTFTVQREDHTLGNLVRV